MLDIVNREDISKGCHLVSRVQRNDSPENVLALQVFMDGFTEDAQSFLYHEIGERRREARNRVTRDVRALYHRDKTQLSDHFPVDGDKQPVHMLCDAWNNLLVWEKNLQRWSIVSLSHYEDMKVCYSHWAYLPKMPHRTLGLESNDV